MWNSQRFPYHLGPAVGVTQGVRRLGEAIPSTMKETRRQPWEVEEQDVLEEESGEFLSDASL